MSTTMPSRTQLASFEDAIKDSIQNVSPTYRYQRKLVAFFVLVALAITMQEYSSSLFYANPVFACQGQSEKLFEEDACPQLDSCQLTNTENITAELRLYCGSRKHERTLLQTGMGLGCWIGLLLVAKSDRLGKKPAFCLGLLLANFTWMLQLLGVSVDSATLLLFSELFSGVANKVIVVSFFVLVTRFLNRDAYELATLIFLFAFFGLSQTLIAALSALSHHWRTLAYAYSALTLACTLAAFHILKEDPTFLFDVGRIDELKRIVREVGSENAATEEVIAQNILIIDELSQEKERLEARGVVRQEAYSVWAVLRWDILKAAVIIGLAGATFQMAGKSIELSIQNLELSYNFNLLILGLSGMCGFATAFYVLRLEPHRKRGLIATALIYGVAALLFLFPFCTQNGAVQTTLIFVLRVLLCWSANFCVRLKVDSFPEKYQMTAISMVEFIVNFGIVASPTVVQLSLDNGISPVVSTNLIRLLVGTLPLFLHKEERIVLEESWSEEEDKAVSIME